jgi:hypothetical protein
VDDGSNRAPNGTHRRRFDGCKCGYGTKTFNYGRSGEGSKSWNAFPDDRGGWMRTRYQDGGRDSKILITLLDSPQRSESPPSPLDSYPREFYMAIK